jgi:hypothetical protein
MAQELEDCWSSRAHNYSGLDSDLAELDLTLAELQRHWSFCVHAAPDARGILAVEHDERSRPLAVISMVLHLPPALGTGLTSA